MVIFHLLRMVHAAETCVWPFSCQSVVRGILVHLELIGQVPGVYESETCNMVLGGGGKAVT